VLRPRATNGRYGRTAAAETLTGCARHRPAVALLWKWADDKAPARAKTSVRLNMAAQGDDGLRAALPPEPSGVPLREAEHLAGRDRDMDV